MALPRGLAVIRNLAVLKRLVKRKNVSWLDLRPILSQKFLGDLIAVVDAAEATCIEYASNDNVRISKELYRRLETQAAFLAALESPK